MDNVGFGLYLTLYGMGTVLGLLLLLMLALKAIGWYDQRRTVRPAAREGNAAARITDPLNDPLPQNQRSGHALDPGAGTPEPSQHRLAHRHGSQ